MYEYERIRRLVRDRIMRRTVDANDAFPSESRRRYITAKTIVYFIK